MGTAAVHSRPSPAGIPVGRPETQGLHGLGVEFGERSKIVHYREPAQTSPGVIIEVKRSPVGGTPQKRAERFLVKGSRHVSLWHPASGLADQRDVVRGSNLDVEPRRTADLPAVCRKRKCQRGGQRTISHIRRVEPGIVASWTASNPRFA